MSTPKNNAGSPELAAVIERRYAVNWLTRCHPDWREAVR